MDVGKGADALSQNAPDFNKAAGDYEAGLKLSADTIMTWSQTLENSILSIKKFSAALDSASKKAGGAAVPGMANQPQGALPGMASQVGGGSSFNDLLRSVLLKGGGGVGNVPGMATAGSGATVPGIAARTSSAVTRAGTAAFDAGTSGALEGTAAGNAMAKGGLAAVELAPGIGQAVMVLKGMWDTLQTIQKLQDEIHKEQRAVSSGMSVGGFGVGKNTGDINELRVLRDKQARLNDWLPAEKTDSGMKSLFATQQLTKEQVSPFMLPGVAGKAGSTGGVMGLMGAGWDMEKSIIPGVVKNQAMFGGVAQGPQAAKAFKDITEEMVKMKTSSMELGIDQNKYMEIQHDLIGENRLWVSSIKDTRANTESYSKSIEQGIVSVKQLSSAFMNAGHTSFQDDLKQKILSGAEMSKVYKKHGMDKADELLQKTLANPFDFAAGAALKDLTIKAQMSKKEFGQDMYRATNKYQGDLMGAKTQRERDYAQTVFGGPDYTANRALSAAGKAATDQERGGFGAVTKRGEELGKQAIEDMKQAQIAAGSHLLQPLREIIHVPLEAIKTEIINAADKLTKTGEKDRPDVMTIPSRHWWQPDTKTKVVPGGVRA